MAQRVVIIGGGNSGIITAQEVVKQKGASVTIIQAEEFNEWYIASPYCLTRPETHSKHVGSMDKSKIKGVTYEFGVVTQLNPEDVVLKSGKSVPFDVLVLAVGFSMPIIKPALGQSWQERSLEVQAYGKAIKAAKTVVVVGSGPVGVEMVCDVKEVAPKDCRVVLVSRGAVLSGSSEKIQQKAEGVLKQQGVEVVQGELAGEAVASATRTTVNLKDGNSLEADVVLPCFTSGFQTGFLASVQGLTDERGRVVVNEFLQCAAQPKIFAVGCANLNEFSGIAKIEPQAKTVAANVKCALAGKPPAKKHKEGNSFMKAPPLQIMGHDTLAFMDPANLPPPVACCARIGFPCCPLPCCWCCCPPCCCGGPCQDPESRGLASFMTHTATPKLMNMRMHKGAGELAPAQMQM